METYTINFDKAQMENCGVRTPEKQSDRTKLWLLGMSEALSVVSPEIKIVTIISDRWWIQFSCNSKELVARIKDRLSNYGATVG